MLPSFFYKTRQIVQFLCDSKIVAQNAQAQKCEQPYGQNNKVHILPLINPHRPTVGQKCSSRHTIR